MSVTVIDDVYMTRADIARAEACDYNEAIQLDTRPGKWWIMSRPTFSIHGSVRSVRAHMTPEWSAAWLSARLAA
jgi:hypothetical protein